MKLNKSIIWTVVLMVILASIYRALPGRPFGFAPQWAIAIFAGAIFHNQHRGLALFLPLLSMFISDLIYHLLFIFDLGSVPGFYEGQWVNYLLFTGVALLSFFMHKISVRNIARFSFYGPSAYFIVSNFMVWAGGGGWGFPKTFDGLLKTYEAGLPFYKWSLISTLVFSTVLFTSWYFLMRKEPVAEEVKM